MSGPDDSGSWPFAVPASMPDAVWFAVQRGEPITVYGVKYVPANDASTASDPSSSTSGKGDS